MNCFYCDKIAAVDPAYAIAAAAFDLGSEAPRCGRHWRYVCDQCGQPAHFMAVAFCPEQGKSFCARCATIRRVVEAPFWAWKYYFELQSPWSGQWLPTLDRLEFEGRLPADLPGRSEELWLARYPETPAQWRSAREYTDADVQANWNANAQRWDAGYDADGDRNRRYQSDEPMLALLGEVHGLRVLDAGSGNGYLCRKLARAGALMTGVELSDEFHRIACRQEAETPLGITYRHGSITTPELFAAGSFDKAVSNYVLMDVGDYVAAVRNVFRALRPGGILVAVISHPSFACGPGGWVTPAPDSPRREEGTAFRVDAYFHRGPYLGQWANFDPVLSFHRPLRDYWETFTGAGFTVDAFEEPSITERGRRELPPSRVEHVLRVPFSCIFRLRKP